jgi:O-antigen ligase
VWPWWAAVAAVAGLLGSSALLFDPRMYAPFYADRVVVEVALALVLALVLLLSGGSRSARVRFDVVDLLAIAFALWQFVATAFSPAPILAVFGSYDVGRGALFWLAVALVFLSVRRLLAGPRFEAALVWIFAVVLVVAAVVAVAQAFGATSLWAVWDGGVRQSRVSGTTGNAIDLGGLGLVAVWLLAGVARWRRFGSTWLAAVVGSLAGAVCVAMSVTRAAALGLALGIVILAVLWAIRRRRGDLVLLAVVALVAITTSVAYAVGPGASLLGRSSLGPGGSLNSSDAKRVMIWGEALRGIAGRPLTGFGPGAFVVIDRLYRPVSQRIKLSNVYASDAHSLPLQVAAGSGLPGLLLGAAFVVALVRLLWRRRRRSAAESPAAGQGAEAHVLPGRMLDGTAAEAALLAALAVACYLVVSPSDAVVVLPAVIVTAAASGPPRAEDGRVWELSGRGFPGVVRYGLVAVTSLALLAALVFGARWWSADRALLASVKQGGIVAEARHASDLAPWEPWYALQAGRMTVAEAQRQTHSAALAEGRAFMARGIRDDPTGLGGYADLARLDMSLGKLQDAVGRLRTALRWNPHQPVLQGLWGYAALEAQRDLKDRALAGQLAGGLERLPVDTPDGWFWLGETLGGLGETKAAAAALAKARAMAPGLNASAFKARL